MKATTNAATQVRRRQRTLLPASMLLLLALVAACTTTRFPEHPEEHRLYEELQAAGHEYYFNVQAGVASQVMGILPEGDARAAIEEIKRVWSEIDRLDSADDITTFVNAQGLTSVGERIAETLEQNQQNVPPDGIDEGLEAAAVKQGLIDAAFELDAAD